MNFATADTPPIYKWRETEGVRTILNDLLSVEKNDKISPCFEHVGLEDGAVSSGWTSEQWLEHFRPMIQAAESVTA